MARSHQGGARRFGAGELGVGDRRVVDDRTPFDEGLLAETAPAVVRRRFAGRPAYRDRGSHEVLRTEQLDAEAVQHLGRDVEEIVRLLELELDPGRLVDERQVREAGNVGCDGRGQRQDFLAQRLETAFVAGQIERSRRTGPDIVRRAPSAGIGVVDEFELDDPGIAGIVGDRQPDTASHDGFTGKSQTQAPEGSLQLVDRGVEFVGAGPDHRVVLGERREHCPARLDLGGALPTEVGLPSPVVQYGPGKTVDEGSNDVVGGG